MLIGKVWVRDMRSLLPVSEGEAYDSRSLDDIRRIIIHHVGGGVNRDFTAKEIADYHVRSKGWPGIAYHFLAHPDGRLEYVGDIATVRYHVGALNRESVGICLAGDFTTEAPRRIQLLRVLQLTYGIWRHLGRQVAVYGHREVSDLTGYGWTECPGDTWDSWKAVLTHGVR